jgi:CxxC-x17-CxxC domain-containing protein
MNKPENTIVCSRCGSEFAAIENATDEASKNTLCPECVAKSDARQMYPVICAACGQAAEVDFAPVADKPVYCKDCYHKIKTGWLYIPSQQA